MEDSHQPLVQEMHLITHQSITQVLNDQSFNPSKVEEWSQLILTHLLSQLKEKWTPAYKFVANIMILSRTSQHISETQMALWDSKLDSKITTKWANESMQCIVSVWGFRTVFA